MKKKLICLISAMTIVMSQGITSFAAENVGELIDSEVEIQEEASLANTESTEDAENIMTDGAEETQEAVTESSVEAASAEEASLTEVDASLTEASIEVLEAVTESSEIISAVEGISGDAVNASLASSTAVEGNELEEQLKQIYEIESYDGGIAVDENLEPNNNAQQAAEIQVNTEYTGVVSSQDDIDIYKFTLTQPGVVTYSFSNEYKNTGSSWSIELIGPNSTKLYSTYICGKNTDTVTSPNFGLGNGSYYLKVVRNPYEGGIDNLPYQIKINYSVTNEWEAEFNDSADTANELTIGEEKNGNIYSSDEIDIFKVNIPDKGKISLEFINDYVKDSSAWWIVELVGVSDYTLYSKTIYGNNMYTVLSPEYGVGAGTYYIRIKGYYVRNVNYKVKINYTATDEWEVETNNTADKATEIPFGKDIHGSLYNSNDIDYYKIIVPQPGKISIKFDHEYVDSNSSYEVKIKDLSGNNLFSGERKGKNIETLQSDTYDVDAGTYYVRIAGGSALVDYTYTFNVNYSSASAGAASFVTRLYEVCLGRTPESTGLNNWTNSLMSGEKKAVDVVQGVLCSQEYGNKGKSNGEVVNDCYQAMLGRDADNGGYAEWTSQLDAGMSVNAIFAGFVGSEEFANLCASYGIQPGTFGLTEERDKNAGVTKFVSRLYTQALGRSYDVNGLNDWCGKINANPSRANILNISTNGFFNSQEFTNKNLDNTEFVKVLYRTFLGRESDAAGLADWVGQLDRGENTRDGVINGFANSQEFSNIMAQYGL